MTMDREIQANVGRSLPAQLAGLHVWRSWIGIGSFLTIDMGGRRINSAGAEVGEFSLWVYGAEWAISRGSSSIADSSNPKAAMIHAAELIEGAQVEQLLLSPESPQMVMRFSNDVRLMVWLSPDPDLEDWMLFLDDGRVLVASQGVLTIESASTPAGSD